MKISDFASLRDRNAKPGMFAVRMQYSGHHDFAVSVHKKREIAEREAAKLIARCPQGNHITVEMVEG